MSALPDILRTYKAPREVLRHRTEGTPREDKALAILLASCALIFVAQWPRLAREAWIDPAINLEARLAGALFAWMMIMPLALYALAFVIRAVMKLFGSTATGYQVRIATYWSLLASVPLWLLSGLVAGFQGPGILFTTISTLGLAAFLAFLLVGLLTLEPGEGLA